MHDSKEQWEILTMTESTMGQKMENHEKRLHIDNHERMRNKDAWIGLLSVAVIKINK